MAAVGRWSAHPAHRDFLPWWAAVGGRRLSAWRGIDVKPPVHVLAAGAGDPADGFRARLATCSAAGARTDIIGGTPWVT